MTARPITIALFWHAIGHGNLGIDALTRSNIDILRTACARAGRVPRFITLCSKNPPVLPPLDADVAIGPAPRIKPLLWGRSDFLKQLRQCDLVVDIGEGDSWADIYGGTRFGFHAGTKLAALALGKPLVLSPQTIGPFNTPWRARLADAIMNRARAVFARDHISTAYLHEHRIKAETAEYIDVAFRLPFEPRPRGAGGGVRAGLNISGLLYRGGYKHANEFGLTIDYPALIHRLMEHWQAQGVEVHLIPHVTAPGGADDDRTIIPELTARYPALIVPPPFASASEAKSYMSGLDFVSGGRMHACIGAFSARTPVVPIAYSRKFNGLFGTLGYNHFVDGRAADTDTAFAQVVAGFDDRARLAADIEPGLALARERLAAYEDRLAAIIGEVV